ncbi:4-hydroxy-2-oxoglutarate aldolase, mitochondrial [Tolypocladium capitatum]|uniref:4-hydroxy-2-oxoglutarate aldolase, mitochondrial n=1 Tax=Tolypocladium capitatum TaxID=45235 RepID=A0A2K3QD87_9HYPO|nr:4-hydroxy-2-oxoglutarate aldolase, mitochondrial [Tolypocladium capitatum]
MPLPSVTGERSGHTMTAATSAGLQTNGGNGVAAAPRQRVLTAGVYVPTVAFFTPDDAIDVETTTSHAKRLAAAAVAGLVTHGSNGEAVHLDRAERQLVTRLTRSALDAADKTHLPVIVGCGAQSTRETIRLCRDAAESGGSHALILPPSYYGGLLTTDLILEHFRAVADASSIPLLIYNFPAPCGGLDLGSDAILALAEHPNIVGVKLTCGNTGKLARIVAGTQGTSFRTFGGSADFTVQTLSVGGHGVIAGLANIAPRACSEVLRLWKTGKTDKAVRLQGIVARGDWAAIKGGFVSVKAALQTYHGYGGQPRKPCALLEGEALEAQMGEFAELVELEATMSAAAAAS